MNKPKDYPKISAIICTLNEEESLPHVLPKIPDWVDEVLLIDGHSTDATVEIAIKLCPRVRVLYQTGKGKGDALKLGVNEAKGEIIVTLDADGETPPEELEHFIKPLLEGNDFVKGSRLFRKRPLKMPRYRWFGNKVLAFTCNGILFNHESPRRGETFVTRKITRAIAHILAGKQQFLYLGNLAAKRDWGYAPEYVAAMWQTLQQDKPGDYVIGTGESHSVQEFLEEAFLYAQLDWNKYVKIDARYFRPTETDVLMADPSKAVRDFGWKPKVRFKDLVKIMVDADMGALGLKSRGDGNKIITRYGLNTVDRTLINPTRGIER